MVWSQMSPVSRAHRAPNTKRRASRLLLGAREEEASHLIERIEPHATTRPPASMIVEGAGLDKQHVQYVHVVHLAVGDVDEGGDRSPQIEQRDATSPPPRWSGETACPREHRQAQIDGRGIEGMTRY